MGEKGGNDSQPKKRSGGLDTLNTFTSLITPPEERERRKEEREERGAGCLLHACLPCLPVMGKCIHSREEERREG